MYKDRIRLSSESSVYLIDNLSPKSRSLTGLYEKEGKQYYNALMKVISDSHDKMTKM